MWCTTGVRIGTFVVSVYINDIKHAIWCDNVKLFAEDTFLFMNDRNIDAVKEKKASDLFENIFRWCVANQLSINSEKTNFVLFMQRISRFLKTSIVFRPHILLLIESNVSNIWD